MVKKISQIAMTLFEKGKCSTMADTQIAQTRAFRYPSKFAHLRPNP